MLLIVEHAIKLAAILALLEMTHQRLTAKLWITMVNVQSAQISVTGKNIQI